MDSVALPAGYRLVDGPPAVADYLLLRDRAGLSARRREQAAVALAGSWAVVHVVHDLDGQTVGMGRVLGDGGWYFHVADMAVLPAHERRGLGGVILGALLERIRREAPPGAYVNLLADPPGRPLYARHGFAPTAPDAIGMARVLS
ncbi:MAG TPA: GNAT family N-acetyltransferase [Solirubrobacteraceae bacterium]|nr:GNAT family N-acetyltransferase [Solirubrobacteraceae bacterium]